jgi:FAD/FMN-containing dehydrogenase
MSITTSSELAPFDELGAAIGGSVVTAADSDWDAARSAWNLAVDQRPDAVATPLDADDVSTIARFAEAHGLRILVQGTGHLASPIDDLSGTILIRTTRLDTIDVRPDQATVRVGAGVLWGRLAAALAEHGLMGLSGSSPDVGVIGYLLGGGFSWFAREHGLACNGIQSYEVVTADGEQRTIDATSDAGLFWALHGGGGNLAIVTAVTMSVFRTTDVYAGMLAFPIDRAEEVWHAYARWSRDVTDRATTCVRLLHLPPLPELPDFLRGQSFAIVDGAIDLPDAAAQALLEPLRSLHPAIDTFARTPVAGLGAVHMDPPGPVPGVGDGALLAELNDGVIRTVMDAAGPGVHTALLAVDLRQLGGAVGVHVPGRGAVDHLPGRFLLYAVGIAPTPDAAATVRAEVGALLGRLAPWIERRAYSNFCESPRDPGTFYGIDDLERLREVKRRVDPHGMMRAAHPIG